MENTLKEGTTLQGKAYRYRIERVLGQGTFGITYLATTQVKVAGALGDLETTMQVAVKEFFMKDINGREECTVTTGSKGGVYANYKAKFAREAENLSRLRHPHIVRVLEYFEANNTVYYAMEYVDGGSLDARIKEKNGLPEAESLALMEQIASAVSYMHAHKMLHLDLKPGNVMLRKDGGVVLIDFGLSKQYDDDGRPETSTSVGSGTPGYAPIEQANYHEGKDFPVTMDVYALGATLFKMLTNVSPPDASVVLNDGFPAYELQQRGVSEGTIACVSRAMAPVKAQRYPSVSAFMDGLRGEGTTFDDEEEKKEPPKVVNVKVKKEDKEKAQKPANKNRWVGGLVGGAVALVVLIFWAWPDSQRSESEGFSQAEESLSDDNFALVDSLASDSAAYVSDETAAVVAAAQQAEQERLAKEEERLAQEEAEREEREAEERRRREEAERRRQEEAERRAREADPSYQVNKGMEYYDEGNYAEAVKWWRKAAEQGNLYGQYNLGVCYKEGQGVSQDYAEALKWYRKAAEQGHGKAQYQVGYAYATGQEVSQDYAEAVRWYRKAAEQGHMSAQNNLANCYYNGNGVTQDYAEAMKWYRKSAEQGNELAQFNLGLCYYNGKGVSQDYAEALKWFRESAAQGYAGAQNYIGECYYYGYGVAEDHAEAVTWYRKAAEQGYSGAQFNLGWCYAHGQGVAKDGDEAVRWYRKAAAQGNSNAKEELDKLGVSY